MLDMNDTSDPYTFIVDVCLAEKKLCLIPDNTTSPSLIAYPDWEAHTIEDLSYPQAIISAIRVRVDNCDRLWVLDEGMTNSTMKHPPTIIVYDLKTDTMIRKYSIPPTQFMKDSRFTNIAVEDSDCQKTYAYAADMGEAAIVVYSWEKNESWRIKHHYFNLNPEACDYSINGMNFTWANSLYGLSLSAPSNGFSTLFFHPMSSIDQFSVSTKYLRNQSIADNNFFKFKYNGRRGNGYQSGASFVDPSTGVLFNALINKNSVACWKTSEKESDFQSNHDTIYMNKETMVYPSDIKVDSNSKLWMLSNKLPLLSVGKFDPTVINFRVFSVPIKDAISKTACDTSVKSKIVGVNSANFASLSFVVFITWLTTLCIH